MTPTPDLLLRTLADPTRRGIFERLCREGETAVGVLAAGAGVSQPVASRHLAMLRRAGLVHDRHQGRNTFCRADPSGLAPLADWTAAMAGFWRDRFDGIETVLRSMDQ